MVPGPLEDRTVQEVGSATDERPNLSITVTNVEQPAPPASRPIVQRTAQAVTTNNSRPSQRGQSTTDKDALWALKRKVVPQWGKRYFYRTKEWGRGYVNSVKKTILYNQAESQPPYIPPKFRKTYARDQAHFKILEKQSLNDMRTARDECEYNSRVAKDNYLKADKEVVEQIKRHQNPAEKTTLLDLWKQETKAGQEHAKLRFSKSAAWLESLPTSKPYYGYRPSDNGANQRSNQYNNVARTPNLYGNGNVTDYDAEYPEANGAHGGFQYVQRRPRRAQTGGGENRPWRRQGPRDFR